MNRLGGLFSLIIFGALPLYANMDLPVLASGKVITTSIPAVTFTLDSPGQEAAKTYVFTMSGETVAELTAQSLGRFSWDGKDINEQLVESGLYVVQIRHHGLTWHSPVMVTR